MRNTCAHGDVLFDLKIPKAIAVIPDFNFNKGDRSSLDSCIKVIYYFLGQISKNRQKDMKSAIEGVFEGVKTNPKLEDIVTGSINYDYHTLLT